MLGFIPAVPCASPASRQGSIDRRSICRRAQDENDTASQDSLAAAAGGGGAETGSAEGGSAESRRDARERAAREREERIRLKREERRKRLDIAEEIVSVQDLTDKEKEDDMVMPEGNYGDNASGLFGWVNQNPSSKNAVYMESFKGDGGNTGEMAQRIRGRGRTEEGIDIKVNTGKIDLDIYVRKVGAERSNQAPIVLVHSALANSWCYRDLLLELKKGGREAYAFDAPGSGYSSRPQPGLGFNFSEKEMMDLFGKIIDTVGIGSRKIILVTQGYVYSQYANLWAIENPDRVEQIVLLNQPLSATAKMPFYLQQYRIPFVAPFVAQDALRAERFLEGGGPYVMSGTDSDRYREPFLESMMPGLAVKDAISRVNFGSVMGRQFEGLKAMKDRVLVVWGTSDKYLETNEADEFQKETGAKMKKIDNAGFLVQSDWPQRVFDAIRSL